MAQPHIHILLVTFPAQGHINPSLQLAKRLLHIGAQVTFATSISAIRLISKTTGIPAGLRFASFDGNDDSFKPTVEDGRRFLSETRSRGSRGMKDIILSCADEGCAVTSLVYNILTPWAAEVARAVHIPCTLLWIQPAAALDIYYYYFHGYSELITSSCKDPSCSIELPGLPVLLNSRDLPSFLLPSSSNADNMVMLALKDQMDMLDLEEKPKVLVNTFDSIESESLRAISKLNLIPIGPLLPQAFFNGKNPNPDDLFRADMFDQNSKNYTEWLNSKPEASVVYVSFGSLLVLPKKQMEEIARGLLESGRPFLWVVLRDQKEGGGDKIEAKDEEKLLSFVDELEKLGMIVPWCSQLEVLSHPSLGCFVTHCGWNSTLESLISGVPVVAFPRWTDQGTNAKLIEEVWKTGVRVTAKEEEEEGLVDGEEIRRCIEMVMGSDERGEEMRRNAKNWKELGMEAMKDGGSSHTNLKSFVEDNGEFK